MITLEALVQVIKLFHYQCTEVDSYELSTWVFNNGLIMNAPEHFREEIIFLDIEKILECLSKEYQRMGFAQPALPKSNAQTMPGIE